MLVSFRRLRLPARRAAAPAGSPCPRRRPLLVGLCAAVIIAAGAAPEAFASGRSAPGAERTVDTAPALKREAGATILVLGDSISAGYGIQRERGWVSQLSARVAGEGGGWTVVNASASGETTSGGLARLPDALEEHDPDVVIIELGGNDGLRGYPVETIRRNLDRMVTIARQAGSDVLLVGMQIPPNYGPRYTRAFAEVFVDVARDHDVPLVPFLLEDVALHPELMQADGIHPTAEAQELLLDTVWPHLAPLLEG